MKINNFERLTSLPEAHYQAIFGVTKPTFDKMLEVLETANALERKKGGRKAPKLTILDRLVITLGYWREYRTYTHIAFDYGVSKSEIGKMVLWTEDTLIKSGAFSLPSKRELLRENPKREAVAADVTEQPIERPKRGRKIGTPARKNATPLKL
jgi:hypothetical protein